MKMFFLGCDAAVVSLGEIPTDAKELAAFNKINTKLTTQLYARVSKPYRYLFNDQVTVSGA